MTTRRQLLTGTTAKAAGDRDVLLYIFQRGAADGLNAVVPHGDDDYYRLRPRIAVPRPGTSGGAIDLDGFFGLNPASAALKPLYDGGRLAFVHAAGVPHGSRSHFDAQSLTEGGITARSTLGTGWLGRHLAATAGSADSTFRAVAISGSVPESLIGAEDPLAIAELDTFGLGGAEATGFDETLGALYASDHPYADVAGSALGALAELAAANPSGFAPESGAQYPSGAFGSGLLQAAQLIKADLGVEVITLDSGNWDHHENLPTFLSRSLTELGTGLAAFDTDLGDRMARVGVIVVTEFGRRAYENGSDGTDHGTASAMLLLGGGVNGGQVAGIWPGLRDDQLALGEDLAITTDTRGVLVQFLERRRGQANAASLFPGYVPSAVPELFRT